MQSAWGRLEERDELVTTHLRLAYTLARRFVSETDTLDDLRQVAAIGLLKAADRYVTPAGASRSRPTRSP